MLYEVKTKIVQIRPNKKILISVHNMIYIATGFNLLKYTDTKFKSSVKSQTVMLVPSVVESGDHMYIYTFLLTQYLRNTLSAFIHIWLNGPLRGSTMN